MAAERIMHRRKRRTRHRMARPVFVRLQHDCCNAAIVLRARDGSMHRSKSISDGIPSEQSGVATDPQAGDFEIVAPRRLTDTTKLK
jgi:hypothetical protein